MNPSICSSKTGKTKGFFSNRSSYKVKQGHLTIKMQIMVISREDQGVCNKKRDPEKASEGLETYVFCPGGGCMDFYFCNFYTVHLFML